MKRALHRLCVTANQSLPATKDATVNTQITRFDLDSIGHAGDSVVRQSRARALPRRRVRVRLQKLSAPISAIAITPVVLVALSTLALMLLARLIIKLVAAGSENRTEVARLP
jgi:hypothetical protein